MKNAEVLLCCLFAHRSVSAPLHLFLFLPPAVGCCAATAHHGSLPSVLQGTFCSRVLSCLFEI